MVRFGNILKIKSTGLIEIRKTEGRAGLGNKIKIVAVDMVGVIFC